MPVPTASATFIDAPPVVARAQVPSWCVSPAALAASLIGLLLLDQLLLWRFLGLVSDAQAALLGLGGGGALVRYVRRLPSVSDGADARTLLAGFAVALVVLALGGEGRFTYATTDWQVRGAVLRDLTLHPWPFLYDVRARPDLLRAPVGMYLLPALVGKAGGVRAAELALLVQNAAVLAALFGLGAALFRGARARWRALLIFLAFSGMDAVGQTLGGQPLWMNAERWALPVFSAHVTQIFWVPQHALAGWAAAVLFLLQRRGLLPLPAFLAAVPLLALWSPLAVMGAMPFAALAGWEARRRGELDLSGIAWPALATAAALPGLLYMAAGSGEVGGRPLHLPWRHWFRFELFEVAPFLLAIAFTGRRRRYGGALLLTVAAVLLLAPFVQVGRLGDFAMRASIPALAILALGTADLLDRPIADRLWPRIVTAALLVGAVTPGFEVWRAVTLPRAPEILCGYFGVVPGGYDTYVTPVDRVSALVAPRSPALVRPDDPAACWDGPWPEPVLFAPGAEP